MTQGSSTYSLPQPPIGTNALNIHFCKTFLRQFHSLHGSDKRRICTAIEKTAALSGHTPEIVAKTLVENGLRAGRDCFPESFVTQMEKIQPLPAWTMAVQSTHHHELLHLWGHQRPIGMNKPRLRRRK